MDESTARTTQKSTNSSVISTNKLLLFPVQDYKHSSVDEPKHSKEGT